MVRNDRDWESIHAFGSEEGRSATEMAFFVSNWICGFEGHFLGFLMRPPNFLTASFFLSFVKVLGRGSGRAPCIHKNMCWYQKKDQP